ncbi:response regulator transcription factor [Streptococcus sp.]|nr:response regulator transcription factor [Streptococcus sp.]MDY3823355.1 response regulator transcription factor [Streptococcus sp.]
MNQLIYVADDEKNIRQLIENFLLDAGFRVLSFETGDALLQRFNQEPADLVISDVMMPRIDGFSLVAQLRKQSDIPIILLTARDSDADYMTGFTMGADDYFTKPFSPVALTLKVKATLNRLEKTPPLSQQEISLGDLHLSLDQRTAFYNQQELHLTNTEFQLLQFLMENAEKALSREELLEKVWGYDSDVETRVTDDTIKRLRKKLRAVDSHVFIETVWGFGFKLIEKKETK